MGDGIIPDPDDPIDRAVLAFQRGVDRDKSFERIVERYYGPLKAFFWKRSCSEDDCLDLNQETFLKVYTGLDGYSWKAAFASWLFAVAVNVYRSWRSGQERRMQFDPAVAPPGGFPAMAREDCEPVMVDDAESPLERIEKKASQEKLREAIEELPQQMRQCLELRIYHELKYDDIADVMGLKIGTVKAHLHQAREKLQELLGDRFERIDFD